MLTISESMTDYEIEMELDKTVKECVKGRKKEPVNLSYWNSGSEYKALIKKIFKTKSEHDIFDYHYYFPSDSLEKVAHKLGFSDEDCKKSDLHPFTQSTLSISILLALFSKMSVKLGIIEPVYFSVTECCDVFKLPYILFGGFIQDINTTFDVDLLLNSDCTAFWFTSPVNSCSIYFNQNVKDGIQKLLDAGKLVVFDESLCINGMELCRTFGVQENLIYIYSPHKTIGLQGIKFSVIAAHKKYYDELDSMADVYGGSLDCSCREGFRHFASDNFDACNSAYNRFWLENFSLVKNMVESCDFASVSPETYGHYAMIFIDYHLDDRSVVNAMKKMIKEQGYFIYPGIMQGFEIKDRLCFRVNMLLNRSDLEKGLESILDWLKNTAGDIR